MRVLFLLFFIVFLSGKLSAQPLSPILTNSFIKKVQTWYNTKQFDSLYYSYADELKSKTNIQDTQKTFTGLYDQIGKLESYEFISENSGLRTYKGNFEKITLSILLATDHFEKIKGIRFVPYQAVSRVSNFKVPLKDVTIQGDLIKPAQSTDLGIIVPGSGPTDRDGNSTMGVKTDTYKKIGEYLQKKGVASLRYDKRGVGASNILPEKITTITLDDYVNDLAELVRYIKKDTLVKRIFLAGHSEGALVALLVAKQVPVEGYISIAGAGETIDKIVLRQLNPESEARKNYIKGILEDIKIGNNPVIEDSTLKTVFPQNLHGYWQSWMKYNPAELISQLKSPALILQGDNDIQVTVEQGELLHAGNPASKLIVIKKMNHVLKISEYDEASNRATYHNPSLPVAEELLNAIIAFISYTR